MPSFDVLADADDEPLFPTDDPLTFTLPDIEGGAPLVFHACDAPVLPDDSVVSLDSRPRSYLIEMVVSQAIEDEQGKVRERMGPLMDAGLVREKHIGDLLKFLNEQREQARKALVKRKTRRPTGASSAS